MKLSINLDKKLFNPTLYPLLLDYSHSFEFYKGSSGSGKSYFITQKLILRALRERINILVCRKYGSTIRNTCFKTFKEVLTQWQLLPYVKIRETDFNIKFPNGSEIIMMGLDEETKLLSLSNLGTIFIEEIYEVEQDIFEQLNLRLRGKTPNQQITGAFNPISKSGSWLYDFCCVNPPSSFYFSETTYHDNPFINEDYKARLEELKYRNPAKYKVYALGEWGVDDEGLVFHNWRVEDFDPQILSASGLKHKCGSDIGYIDPTTIIESLYDEKNHKIYVCQEFYKTGCQLDEVAKAIRDMGLAKTEIVFDSAEPRTIDYFKTCGFFAKPCIKGANSVEARIRFLQNNEIIVRPQCVNLIRELENFSYEKDRKTGKFKDSLTHEFSHAIDGLGYSYSNIYTQNRITTLDKSILGL